MMGETGQLSLAPIEDEVQFERYMNMIAKIEKLIPKVLELSLKADV